MHLLQSPVAEVKRKCRQVSYCILSGDQLGCWKNWNITSDEFLFAVDKSRGISSVFVPSVDSLKKQYLMRALTRCGRPVLLVGGPGSSKTSLIRDFMEKYSSEEDEWSSWTISFSYSTSPSMFQARFLKTIGFHVGQGLWKETCWPIGVGLGFNSQSFNN